MPTPAGATTLTMYGRRSSNDRRATSSSWSRSASRPTIGVDRRRVRTLATPISGRATTGTALPFASISTGAPNSKRSPTARTVRSPTRIPHCSAACWSRAAVFTGSPVTRIWALASREAMTSPPLTPRRIGVRVARAGSARTRSRRSIAADRARAGSSSCATGDPKTAMIASPMNFSTRPPCRSTKSVAMPNRRARTARTSSGSSASPSAVDPTTSANRTVTSRRSSAMTYPDPSMRTVAPGAASSAVMPRSMPC